MPFMTRSQGHFPSLTSLSFFISGGSSIYFSETFLPLTLSVFYQSQIINIAVRNIYVKLAALLSFYFLILTLDFHLFYPATISEGLKLNTISISAYTNWVPIQISPSLSTCPPYGSINAISSKLVWTCTRSNSQFHDLKQKIVRHRKTRSKETSTLHHQT